MYSVLILAGGMAKRLYPVSQKIPKSLIKINNKPFIDYQLNYLKTQGITNVVISVGNLGDMIRSHIVNKNTSGLNVNFSFDGPNLLGTGGAVKKSLPKLTDVFFVMYGDSFLPINFKKIQSSFNTKRKLALMTIYKKTKTLWIEVM